MSSRSYYEVLEVTETASDAEIRQAYRRLAMQYHPDKNPDGGEAFKDISHAYETLSDPERRAAYDRGGFGMGGGFDMGDMDSEWFYGEDMAGAAGADVHPLAATLEDLFRGKKVRVKLRDAVEVSVEPGMRDGQRIVLGGKGDQRPGQPPQDLVFAVRQAPHAVFRRAGDDLAATARIDLAEALCGFSRVLLTHLDGRPLEVSHRAGVLRPGDVLCVRGEGMPLPARPRARGDLFVALDIVFPDRAWRPDPGLAAHLPRTARDAQEDAKEDDARVVVGRPITADEFRERMPEPQPQPQPQPQAGHGRSAAYQGAGPTCEQQ